MKLFLIAGEPSGDRLGGALMAGLRELAPGVRFDGIGGPEMAAQGLASRFPMAELSVMGLWEVLPRYRALKARIRETATAIADARPDAVLTIDSPDFCLRVLRRARAANPRLRTIHYVAPSVWAWRPGRAAKMAPLVDHVLALLPFEPPYMQAVGMTCDFVGHPVVAEPQATRAEAAAFRAAHAIAPEAPLILTLPGSRRGEIARLGPRFAETLRLVLRDHPGARVVVPTVADQAATLREILRDWPGTPLLLTPAEHGPEVKRAAFAAADAALAASGTVSLELAASGTPMVIGYDFNPLTRALVARMLRVETVTLVNLISETRAIPEFLGASCRAAPMAQALSRLLSDPQARAEQRAAMDLTMARLGHGGEPPGLRAARSVLDHLSA
ncbi:MAG: lipid-A-disaccharide synthase [Rhodobacteraceae bacterium]|nr:lipid-A-disaccharide synthase [Paracoccaceae bacterium]